MNNQKILLKVIIGSQAYNLASSDSDTDRRGVYLESKEQLFGLKKAEPSCFPEDPNDTIYPFRHFISLLCKGNPNIIEMIYLNDDFIEYMHPLFKKYIIDNKEKFLSKTLIKSYLGYTNHQLSLIEKNNREKYSVHNYDGKAAMHIFRLLLQLNNLIDKKDPIIYVSNDDRELLLDIRYGRRFYSIEALKQRVALETIWIENKIKECDLKDKVDYDEINDLMIKFYDEVL